MAQNLVIVESPAKAKTIEKFLGKDFKVASSFGHIADLPAKELGVDVEGDFSVDYKVSSDKKKVVSELKKLAKKSQTVWLASDEDREGEAIAWHLANTLELDENNSKRIVFSEITKNAILKAIEKPRTIDYNLVNAQQARREPSPTHRFHIEVKTKRPDQMQPRAGVGTQPDDVTGIRRDLR